MHKTVAEGVALAQELAGGWHGTSAEMVVAPPFLHLSEVKHAIQGSKVKLASQNCHAQQQGAFTGEVSAYMLKDFGVDYVRCGNLELAKKLGAEEFAPYVCMSDIALSDALGWGLIRTQTLADGCSHCDFRFQRDGETRISSKTPDVQEAIERIERRSRSASAW